MTRRRPVSRSVAQQGFVLRGRYPDAELSLAQGRLRWIGTLQPLPSNSAYIVSVNYREGTFPVVRVLSDLPSRPGESLPHIFSDGSLCLHEDHDWNSSLLIADSTVPWAAEWLAYYEIWKATGDWHGGGVWPPCREPTRDYAPCGRSQP